MAAYTLPHFRIMGVCWVIYGAIRLLLAVWLIVFSTTATVMFGALLNRVPDPFSLMSAFHLLYLIVVVWSFAAGVIGIVAGLALLAGRSAGRTLGIVAALLSICEIPLGVTIGSYTLIVLLTARTESVYVTTARAA